MNGPLKRVLKSKLAKLAQDPDQLPGLREYATVIATIENALTEQAAHRCALLGVEQPEAFDVDERAEQLVDLAGSLMDESTGELYVRELTDVEAGLGAESYLGMTPDEWADQVERWAESYRREGAPADLTDRDLLERHTEAVFGVDAETFREQVVDVERYEAERRLFQHRFDAIHDAHERANTELGRLLEDTEP